MDLLLVLQYPNSDSSRDSYLFSVVGQTASSVASLAPQFSSVNFFESVPGQRFATKFSLCNLQQYALNLPKRVLDMTRIPLIVRGDVFGHLIEAAMPLWFAEYCKRQEFTSIKRMEQVED